MIKLTEEQKRIVNYRIRSAGSSPDEWDLLDEVGIVAQALLQHAEFDLVQNCKRGARSEAMALLVRTGCTHLQSFVQSDVDDENSYFRPNENDFEFQNAKEQMIKELGL